MTKKNALIIFVKTPVPGLVKTRLQPDLTEKQSAELYTAFLKDIDHKLYERDDFDCWYAVSPENFQKEALGQIIHLDHYFLQDGMDLGERMNIAFHTLFIKGYKKIVLVGSDLPSISTRIVNQAFQGLETKDCVVGPSKDGGYYLIALKNPMSELFVNLPWSSSEVLEKTIEILYKKGLKYRLLPEFEDIDSYKELVSFYQTHKMKNKNDPDFPRNSWAVTSKLMENR